MSKEYQRTQLATLRKRILEPRQFIQVLVGPRQTGKSWIIRQLLDEKLYLTADYAVDEVVTASSDWLDNVWEKLRLEMNSRGEKTALLVIDEIQRIDDWSLAVKRNWDLDTKNHTNIKLIISGSSRLLLQKGLSESLFGRYELIRVPHWSYAEMKTAFRYTPEQFVWFGGYPGAARLVKDESRFKNYVKDSIIEASLTNDILMLTPINKPALLRRVFEFGTAYSSQIFSYNKMLGQLDDVGNTVTLAKYLRLLDQAGLIGGLENYSQRLLKTKASSPKFQVYNTGLLSAMRTDSLKAVRGNKAEWGRVVESAIGAILLNKVSENSNITLNYFREKIDGEELEVDFVLKYGQQILGIEVKSGAAEPNMKAIAVFKKKYPQADVLLVGDSGMPWRKFLEIENLEDLFDS
jgi:predicted AAA+ superfamily ATPase